MDNFLASNAWLPFALCAVASVLGALTVMHHVYERGRGLVRLRWSLLAAAAALALGIGFALGGMQAGDNPVLPRETTIPAIRVFWLVAGVLALSLFVVYWRKRIHLRGSDK